MGQRQCRLGHPVAVVGPLLEPYLAGGDDGDLRRREDAVGQEQHEHDHDLGSDAAASPGLSSRGSSLH